MEPTAEVTALSGARAAIVLAEADAADVVLSSREELSFRWHPLRTTSPNILATARIVAGALSSAGGAGRRWRRSSGYARNRRSGLSYRSRTA